MHELRCGDVFVSNGIYELHKLRCGDILNKHCRYNLDYMFKLWIRFILC